jgi:uncharacterized membrane protein YhhN
MTSVMWLAAAVCVTACGVLVAAEAHSWKRRRIASKVTASVAFIVVGTSAFVATNRAHNALESYQTLVLLGLVLGAVGDAALLGAGKRAFLGGLVAFLFGHIAYVAAAMLLVPAGAWWDAAGLLALAPPVAGLVVLRWLWPHLGEMRVPVIVYMTVIVTMMIGALAVLHTETVPAPSRQLFALGAALFFASDVAVARDKFVAHQFINRAWGLPCYYAGQLLIAWSVRA